MEDSFPTDPQTVGRGRRGGVQAVMRAMGSDGERQMKLHPLARRSPPAVRPSSQQAVDQGLKPLLQGYGKLSNLKVVKWEQGFTEAKGA